MNDEDLKLISELVAIERRELLKPDKVVKRSARLKKTPRNY